MNDILLPTGATAKSKTKIAQGIELMIHKFGINSQGRFPEYSDDLREWENKRRREREN